MAKTQRFLFETSFDSDHPAIESPDDAAPSPSFTAADLEQARLDGFADGEAAGREESIKSIEKQILNGLGRLVEQMAALSAEQARYQEGLTQRSVELALTAIRKTFPALARHGGLDEIEALLADCLQEARGEPRIVVRCADALVGPLGERIDALIARSGHDGIVSVLADDSLGPADCRVEWAEGGAERVIEHMWRDFEAATRRVFSSPGDESDDAAVEPPHETPAGDAASSKGMREQQP